MEIVGKIIAVCPVKKGVSQNTGKNWMSQEYVLETEGEHPEKCVFTVFGEEKIRDFNLKQNDMVTVSINLNAREYQGRWFNSIQAWRVMRAQTPNRTTTAQGSSYSQSPNQQDEKGPAKGKNEVRETVSQEQEDDLPF